MRKRLRKKKEPKNWGRIALVCEDDVDKVPGVESPSGGPEKYILVIIWRTRKQRRLETKSGKRPVATYEEFDRPALRRNSLQVGCLHFSDGSMEGRTITHEVIHASMHGERLIGGEIVEERLCYRADRLFSAVAEFRDTTGS